jgi:Na+-driven multidrug efflux pump
VAGSATAGNIEGFIYAGIHAFQQTALTFSSQNYGANRCKRVDKVMGLCILYSVLYGLVVGNLSYVFGHQLASIYTPGEEAVIAEALLRMKITCTTYFICSVLDVFSGTLRGIGYSILPMVVSLVGACGIRLIWVATIFQIYHTPTVLFLSYPFSWTVTTVTYCVLFFLIRKHAYAKAIDIQTAPASQT